MNRFGYRNMLGGVNLWLDKNVPATKIKQQWSVLNGREKRLVGIFVSVICFVLFYYLFAKPIYLTNLDKKSVVEEKRQILVWLNNNRQDINELKANSQQRERVSEVLDDSQPISSILENLLNQYNNAPKSERIVPKSDQELEIWFKEVDFNQLIVWLNELQRYRIDVSSVQITKVNNQASQTLNNTSETDDNEVEAPGLVDAYLQLIKKQ